MKFINETDFISTNDNETTAMVPEENDAMPENTTFVTNEDNSTYFEMDTTTKGVFEHSTTEVFESSTTEFIETTTLTATTTIVRSNGCVDSEFECCPDGETSARVIDILL
jgi:hypothetical protein